MSDSPIAQHPGCGCPDPELHREPAQADSSQELPVKLHFITVPVALNAPKDDREGMMQEIIWQLRQVGEGSVIGSADFPDIIYLISAADADDHAEAERVVNDRVTRAIRDSGFAPDPGWFVHDPALLPIAA